MNYTPVSQLGEFGLIRHLTEKIKLEQPSTVKGVGDDAAVIEFERTIHESSLLLFSTDMLTEGIHFDFAYTPLRHLGYKAVAVNVSDICAMNGTPTQLVISIGISNQFSVESLEELYKGIRFAAQEYKVDIVGGDTVSSKAGLVINVAIIGKVNKDKVTYRGNAKVGDIICVSGDLGGAYAGLLILEKGKKTFSNNMETKPDLSGYEYPIKRQLMPLARKDIVELFHTLNIVPSSMIDISDGLSSELHHICEDSRTGCLVYEERIPIHEATIKVAEEFKMTPTALALRGGEDYELLFTVSKTDFEKLKDSEKVSPIGEIVPANEGICFLDKTGKMHPLDAKGWDSVNSGN